MQRHGGTDMATEGDVELELGTETSGPERPPEKPWKHDSGAVDLERVTDYAEEKEIQSSNLETVRLAVSTSGRAESGGALSGCKWNPRSRTGFPSGWREEARGKPSLEPAACERELGGDCISSGRQVHIIELNLGLGSSYTRHHE